MFRTPNKIYLFFCEKINDLICVNNKSGEDVKIKASENIGFFQLYEEYTVLRISEAQNCSFLIKVGSIG